jgi:hypothetical protein
LFCVLGVVLQTILDVYIYINSTLSECCLLIGWWKGYFFLPILSFFSFSTIAVMFEIVEMYIFQIHLHYFFFAYCMLKQNRDLFYFWVCSRIYTLLWKDFSCFRRLILSLSWKSNDRGGLKFWTCLHATGLLAAKFRRD